MVKKLLWMLLVALSVVVGLYPGLFFWGEKKVGILKIKPGELFLNPFWYGSFYVHIIFGGLALLIGWIQFSPWIRRKNIALHRRIGRLYVIAVLLSALAGFNIAFYATGGLPVALGFISLSLIWFYTTLMAYFRIRSGQVVPHKNMMIYSYACCFAAVTLRAWMPLLIVLFGSFETAYTVVAWWCWIPNLTIAYFLTQKSTLATPEQ
ncbi:DUF2306 domain-containing protein [Chitinophaga ginsengisegetis]|uniref:DUF2306 domain-containing protein n=1 Tax=Chitinophaga ginsengisegetis TaxID=393003 RepID=UPI000DB94266|nr:DUF2306 domain-containing protein [Chitinophaga ginsengisegetis]MDR6568198.1 putative membrane protein [Chitinophaga ginsengisegetis]MDR6647247.1 putative membrane protein [Chitinophaga ginsengisegetis]MDR6653596.1 putative membrane protein [Chitinophaga ginsengisegetis]